MKFHKCDLISSIANLGLHSFSSLYPLYFDDIFYKFQLSRTLYNKEQKDLLWKTY